MITNEQLISAIRSNASQVFENLTTDELVQKALERNEGQLTDQDALAADTGEFTGRSPKDKFMVKDSVTENTAWWGPVNQPVSEEHFDGLLNKVTNHLQSKEVFGKPKNSKLA